MAEYAELIAQLGEAINKSTASQAQLEENTGLFNTVIANGLQAINATIQDINGLLRQITDKINDLQDRINQLELDAGEDPDAARAAEMADLRQKLAEAQRAQVDATDVMNRALITLNTNTTVMDRTMNVQKTTDMQNQIQQVHQSLLEMRKNLGDVLRGGPARPPPKPRRLKPGPPKPPKPGRRGDLPGEAVPPGDQGAADVDNDEEFQQELDEIDGGSRRRRRKNKTAKKQGKTRKTKKNKKQKGGYEYKTRRRKSTRKSTYDSDTASSDSNLGRGRGRGIYKKSKKRRIARS
jgi:uncharacterized phage infection (PIP) family protein YhgE